MNRIFFILIMLFAAVSANADGLDRLVRKYKKTDGAVYAASIEELQKFGNVKVTEERDGEEVDAFDSFVAKMKEKGIKKVRVLQLDKCSSNVKRGFAREAQEAVPCGYEGFLQLDDNDEPFGIYLEKCKGYIKILILMRGEDNSGFIEVESDNDILNSLLNF